MRKHIALIIAALGSATLASGCNITPQEAQIGVTVAQTANTTGAIVAGVVNPAVGVPAGTVAGALNGAACGIGKAFGASC
jgi:hypothetical protein